MRIDAHQHFWDPARHEYPWMAGDAMDPVRRAFTPDDLSPVLRAADIDGTILVQTVSSVAETREFLQLAAATDFIAGVVGWVDLTSPAVGDDLDELLAGPGRSRLVGIRHQVHDEPDSDAIALQVIEERPSTGATVGRPAKRVQDQARPMPRLCDFPQLLHAQAEPLRAAASTQVEALDQPLGERPASALGKERVPGMQLDAGCEVFLVMPVSRHAHIAGDDPFDAAIDFIEHLSSREAGINLDS